MTSIAIAQTNIQTALSRDIRARISLAALGACAIALVFYSANVYSVVSHTVALEHAKDSLTSLTSAVNSLDARYLQLSSALTPDALAAHGLTAGTVSLYISRTASTASLGALASAGHEL